MADLQITVICMYKAQLRFIRRLFRDHGNLKVRVETVDGYQGKVWLILSSLKI